MTTFVRLMTEKHKETGFLEGCSAVRSAGADSRVFEVDPEAFRAVPGAPFAYWVSTNLRSSFVSHPALEAMGREARRGPSSGNDFWRIRLWHEVLGTSAIDWRPLAKGGAYSRFHSDIHLVVAWDQERETFHCFFGRPGRETERVEASAYFFRPGLTWPRRTQGGLSLRALPQGCIFADKGPSAFVANDSPIELLALLAVVNSKAFGVLVSLQMAFGSYEVGVIQKTPIPNLNSDQRAGLAALARRAWSLKRTLGTIDELSHAFLLPAALRTHLGDYDPPAIESELAEIQAEIDDIAFDLYGFSDADRAAALGSSGAVSEDDGVEDASESDDDDGADAVDQTDGLLSWAAGVAFGRFDWRVAIRDTVLRPRLLQAGCMVVYDPDHRYHDLCLGLGDERIRVIDASESSIESRQEAIMALREVGKAKREIDALVVYVPQRRTETDEEKQADPFSIYAQSGAVFPQDDGDDYLSLCLRAKPDHATEIRRIFAGSPNGPSFPVIDAIGGGASWPQLRAALRVESGREILTALLAPSAKQADALKSQEGWSDEAREFLRATLGMSVKTRGKTWTSIADELWRFVLFSEFVFDLPVVLPESLKGVPHSPIEAEPIVKDVCDRLRTNPATRDIYIERAEAIEVELSLPEQCRDIDDLGDRDTFPFEERTFLKAAIKGISSNETDTTRRIIGRHRNSVWLGKGESQAQWELIRTGLALIECCDDNERQLPEHARSQADLLDFYLGSLREADRLQREFEQAVGDFLDPHGIMHEVIDQARFRYRRLAEKVQTIFTKHIESAGWPPEGRLANADVYDRLLADRLKENGRKVAYLMVDALRYELGVTLEKQLSEDGPVELQAAYAQLPTITLVGMASLLPGARTQLSLEIESDALAPKLGTAKVGNVTQRMDVLRKKLGDRFQEMPLGDFVRGKPKITPTVDLLVLRSTEIDSQLESNPETTLGLIPSTLKLIRVALHKLRGMGFKEAVIVTDHGFFLNGHAAAGDVCTKPQGNWPINAHDRALLGNGNSDSHSVVLNSEKLGIRGSFAQVALPKSMAPYRAGHLYFHGGASLAEAVVPVIIARLDNEEHASAAKMSVELNYKNGAKRITTRVPVVEIALVSDDMFSQEESVEVLIEAQDGKGNVVGEPRAGGDVNPATRTITLTPGQRKQIALRMDPDFEGKFSIKALNPTTLASLSALNLETDYTV